jgi:peptide/nickel transport system permease protein
MIRYILRRLIATIPTLLGVSIIVFLFIHLIPGDPATAMLRENAPAEVADRIREELGLNKPLYEQYLIYLLGNDTAAQLEYRVARLASPSVQPPAIKNPYRGILRGDLGRSLVTKDAIISELRQRFPATVELAIAAILVAMAVGIPAGIVSAIRRNSVIDTAAMIMSLIGVSMPIYWLGMMALMLFAVILHLVPVGTRMGVDVNLQHITNFYILDSLITGNFAALGDVLRHLIVPACVLGTVPMAIMARMTRSSMLEALNQDYIRTAHAKGLREGVVVLRHALKNALLPVITVIGLEVGFLFSGAILTESIFAWPGVGRWMYESIIYRDYPVIQGVTLMIAVIFVVVNLVVDLSYAVIDPRIRYQ